MFSSYWEKRVNDETFKDNLQNLYRGFWETIENYKIEDISYFLNHEMKTYYVEDNVSEGARIADRLRPHVVNVFSDWFFSEELSFRERIEDDTWEEWKSYSKKTIEFPPEFVESIMRQPAIKELFTDVIHNAIIAFTKKINPIFSAVSSLGIEKQIRDFIVPFMDNVVDIAVQFVLSEENRGMFEELNAVILENIADFKPEVLRSVDFTEWSDEIIPLIDKTLRDKKFQKSSRETFSSFLSIIETRYKNQTIGEIINDKKALEELKNHTLSIEEINLIRPFFLNEHVMNFIEKEISLHES